MCSVKFASHCPSKHVSILLYFLIHEFDTHSSTVPKYITLSIPDKEIFQKLLLESVQFSCSVVSDSLWPHESQHSRPPCPSPTLGFAQTHVRRVGDAIQPSHPLLPSSPPAPNPSQYQGLSNELTLHMSWPKYWSFSFSISPSNEYSGLISFRMDWLDVLGIISCKSDNSCSTGIECCIFLTGTIYKPPVLHSGVDQNRNVPNQGDVFIGWHICD